MNQIRMFMQECTTQEYIENTLDPIASRSLFHNDQYFYYLCMMQRYTRQSCPTYLTREGFDLLKVKKRKRMVDIIIRILIYVDSQPMHWMHSAFTPTRFSVHCKKCLPIILLAW